VFGHGSIKLVAGVEGGQLGFSVHADKVCGLDRQINPA
jgi:hypothetical protein